jgi:N-acetylglucosamine kinase-like BadF-type ATPase
MRLFLGMDVGGTRTRALIADENGRALGLGEAGPGNHEVVGYDGLRKALSLSLEEAIEAADRDGMRGMGQFAASCAGAGFGMAGFDWPSEREATLEAISVLGLSCPLSVHNDSALGLAAGSKDGYGINVSAGTSNNCYGLWPSKGGGTVEGGIAGASSAVGEEGGGIEIAKRAVVAVNHARIKRGPDTMIEELLLSRTGYRDAAAFIEAVASERLEATAAWAPLVFEAAASGDGVAMGILDWAGRELGESALAVARQIGIEGESFDLVLSGSLFSLKPSLAAGIAAALSGRAPGARLTSLGAPPVAGGVLLGMRAAGLDTGNRRESLLASLALLAPTRA